MTKQACTRALALIATLAAIPVAAADDDARDAVEDDLRMYMHATVAAKEDGDRAINEFRGTPDECRAVVARGTAAGIAPSDVLDGTLGVKYVWKKAASICDDYARWHLLAQAAVAIHEVESYMQTANAVDPGDVKPDWIAGYREFGTKCLAKVDALIAAGAPADVPVPINTTPMTLTAGKAKWCQGIITWADSFAAASAEVEAKAEAERQARLAEATARWRKAGFAGERLATFVEFDGDAWYVARRGCVEETRPAALRKARVLYRWLSSGDWSHTLVRYEWRGDKLARTAKLYFDTRGKASAGCR